LDEISISSPENGPKAYKKTMGMVEWDTPPRNSKTHVKPQKRGPTQKDDMFLFSIIIVQGGHVFVSFFSGGGSNKKQGIVPFSNCSYSFFSYLLFHHIFSYLLFHHF